MLALLNPILIDPKFQKPRLWIAAIVYILVLVLGSIPGARAELAEISPGIVLHATTYAFLTFCLFGGIPGNARRKAFLAWLGVAFMGAFDEYLQSFFPYRSATVGDWLIDICSALLVCVWLFAFWYKNVPSTSQST